MNVRLPGRYWADRPLRSKGLFLAALPFLIFIGALVWVADATLKEDAAEASARSVLQTHADVQQIETLIYRAALDNAGAAQLDLRLTQAEQELGSLLVRLFERVRDPEQRARLAVAEPLLREAITVARAEGLQGSVVLGRLDSALDDLRERDEVLLAERIRSAERAQSHNLRVTMTAGVLGLVGSLAAMLLFSTGIVRRIRVLEGNADRLTQGKALEPPPIGADEIGRLGSALARASTLLSDRQQQLEGVVSRLFEVQEEERRRVAYDLHDGVAQVAAAAHGHLQAYAERFPPAGQEAQAALERGLMLVQRTVRETRTAIAGLRPTVLDDFGLARALAQEVETLRNEGRDATLVDQFGLARPPPIVETALFRIAQEALTNVRKHAGSSASVQVLLKRRADMLVVEVHDRGSGLTAATEPAAAGERVGLNAMRERAALVGGHVTVEVTPGRGWSVFVQVPTTQI